MIDAILINPSEKEFLGNAGDRSPLGLMYISSALKKNKISNKIIDLNHSSIYDACKIISEEKPKYLGISIFTTAVYNQAKGIINFIGKDKKWIAGGFHVTAEPESLDVKTIRGYGEDGIVSFITQQEKKEFDINRYAIPNRQDLDNKLYNMSIEGFRSTTMTTARGCPYSCIFCGNFDKKVKFRDMGNIEEEIKIIKSQKYDAVYFTDDSFTLNPKHFIKVTELAKKHDLKYRIATRASLLDKGIVRHLKDTGCVYVGLGIESGDDEVLKKSNKGMTRQDNETAVRLLAKENITTKGFFIIGLPEDTHKTAYKTIDFAVHLKKLGLKYADFYCMTPYVGSPIRKDPDKYSIELLTRDPDRYIQTGESMINLKNLSNIDINILIKKAHEVWDNPDIKWRPHQW